MSFFKSIFKTKDEPIKSNADFWTWFQKKEKDFFNVVKIRKNIEKDFFDLLSPKLKELKEGFFFVTGMFDDHTVELVLTADGSTKNIVFIEELIEASPKITGWKFTALKPALDIKDVSIAMGDYQFNRDNMSFYANVLPDYPDEIDITVVHNDLTEENEMQILNGVYIFLDNYLGELELVNNIDDLKVINKKDAEKELIPIEKLKHFLIWRQKEFVEKYEGVRYDTENDTYSVLEAELESGSPLVALIDTELLNWDSKASHPWISIMTFKYDGSNNNGLPNETDYQLLGTIEEEIIQELKDKDGYLNIGHQTAKGERNSYFASKDFRKPSKVFYKIQQKFSKSFEIEYDIYKDKYWQSFERFAKK